ncbi:hypothetical protein GCM10027612_77490 [Microbispora bryophytorum subsp. camponoti]
MLRTAAEAGASVIALCDTNGGMLPDELADVVHEAAAPGPASASTATTTPAARSPTPWPR